MVDIFIYPFIHKYFYSNQIIKVSIYRDILSLFRSMIAEGPIELETETWLFIYLFFEKNYKHYITVLIHN